ncbi:MAG TPA: flagellar protein FlaG [Solirubrobacteraceae bacterium]|nr:flagellar protein FlaG [Solirubrobacteraceae bacterium]
MIAGVQPGPVRESAFQGAPPARAPSGNPVPVPGGEPPVAASAPPLPDLSRAAEVLDRWLADSQRSLQFRRDAEAGRTVILVVDPNTGEILRQIPPRERLALARSFAAPRPPVIDLRA